MRMGLADVAEKRCDCGTSFKDTTLKEVPEKCHGCDYVAWPFAWIPVPEGMKHSPDHDHTKYRVLVDGVVVETDNLPWT